MRGTTTKGFASPQARGKRALQFELTIEARRFLIKTGSKERHHNERMCVYHRRGVRSDPSDPLSQLKNVPRWVFFRRSDPQRSQRSTQSTEKTPRDVRFSIFHRHTANDSDPHISPSDPHVFLSDPLICAIHSFLRAIHSFQMFRQCRRRCSPSQIMELSQIQSLTCYVKFTRTGGRQRVCGCSLRRCS